MRRKFNSSVSFFFLFIFGYSSVNCFVCLKWRRTHYFITLFELSKKMKKKKKQIHSYNFNRNTEEEDFMQSSTIFMPAKTRGKCKYKLKMRVENFPFVICHCVLLQCWCVYLCISSYSFHLSTIKSTD